MGDGRDVGRANDEDRASEDNSEGVGASRTIFLFTSVRSCRVGSRKGGLSRPSLGVIMNFWFECGIERVVDTASARSVMFESGEKGRV